MSPQLSINKGKNTFFVGDYVRVKPKSEAQFIGQITKIEGNVISIKKGNSFYYNYSIKQIFKTTKTEKP